jgi:transposase
VLSLGPGVQIVLATESIDLRRGHDGLVTLVRSLWKADPYSGTLFVFFGRRMDRVKVLFFSAGGFVVYYKRLERGRRCLADRARARLARDAARRHRPARRAPHDDVAADDEKECMRGIDIRITA